MSVRRVTYVSGKQELDWKRRQKINGEPAFKIIISDTFCGAAFFARPEIKSKVKKEHDINVEASTVYPAFLVSNGQV
jgi:hypothetical protein